MNKLISIVTPAYNRAKILPALYKSLQEQTSKNFKWLIIDDGSTDNTDNIASTFISEKTFPVTYIKKENGGKHTALNVAFEIIDTELTFIVDSDDIITPDAVKTIESDWIQHKDDNICGISYLRGYTSDIPIGDRYPKDHAIDNFISVRVNRKIRGDKAEVWVTKFLQEYRFPVVKGEKFFSEGWLWVQLSIRHNMLFRNKILYITKYLDGGLTMSGRRLRIHCPVGGMISNNAELGDVFTLGHRIKCAILCTCYSKFAGIPFKKAVNGEHRTLLTLCYPAGIILFHYWKKFL